MSRNETRRSIAIASAVKGTVIALATWLVLYAVKEQFGRTAALIVAAALFFLFVLWVWARARVRANPPSD